MKNNFTHSKYQITSNVAGLVKFGGHASLCPPYKKYFKLIFVMVGLLSGCTEMNAQFDCPMKPGVMCKSVSEVNMMIERGQLGKSTTSIVQSSENTLSENFAYQKTNAVTFLDHPVRSGETIMRIWMAPYQDVQGNYYQATVFYTVVKPGQWLGSPLKAVKADV